MIDRFHTADPEVIQRACEALRTGAVFTHIVERPECAPGHRRQHWSGYVSRITTMLKGFEIEVLRNDL